MKLDHDNVENGMSVRGAVQQAARSSFAGLKLYCTASESSGILQAPELG